MEDQDDPLMKGEFMVMLELMQELPGAKEGKEKVKVYDNNILHHKSSLNSNYILIKMIFRQSKGGPHYQSVRTWASRDRTSKP